MKTEILSLKVEPELKAAFKLVAESNHRPASQVIRELMRHYILTNREVNELTSKTLISSENNENLHTVDSIDELYSQLGI